MRKFLLLLGITPLGLFAYYRLETIVNTDYPLAPDSFYYLIEFKSYLLRHEGYFNNAKLFFLPLSSFGRALGIDERMLLNLVIASSLIFFSVSGFLLSNSLLFAFFPWSSLLFAYDTSSFPRQIFALSIFTLGFSLLNKTSSSYKSVFYYFSLLLLTWSAGMHLISFASVGMLILLWLFSRYNKVLAATLVIFVSILSILIVDHITSKTTLNLAATTVELGWVRISSVFRPPREYFAEFSLLTFGWITSVVICIRKEVQNVYIWLFLFIWLTLNLPIWDLHSEMASRLAYAAPVFFFIASALISGELKNKQKSLYVMLLTFLFSLPGLYNFNVYPYIERPYKEIDKNSSVLNSWMGEGASIVAPHGVQFAATYFLNRSATRLPPMSYNENGMYRISRRGTRSDLNCETISSSQNDYNEEDCLILNDTWIIEKIDENQLNTFRNQIVKNWESLVGQPTEQPQ